MSNANDFIIENGELKKYTGPGGAVIVPDGVTSIGAAFRGCAALTEITLPDGVEWIGSGAFFCCTNLMRIQLPDSLRRIDTLAFCKCTSLTHIHIPSGVTELGNAVFRGCSNLREVIFPDGVRSMGKEVFRGCKKLTDEQGFRIVGHRLYSYHGTGGAVIVP